MWTFQAHRLDVAAVISLMSPTLIKHQQAQYLTSALSSFSRDSNNGAGANQLTLTSHGLV